MSCERCAGILCVCPGEPSLGRWSDAHDVQEAMDMVASSIARQIMEDIEGRRGFRNILDDMEDEDREEMLDTWTRIAKGTP